MNHGTKALELPDLTANLRDAVASLTTYLLICGNRWV